MEFDSCSFVVQLCTVCCHQKFNLSIFTTIVFWHLRHKRGRERERGRKKQEREREGDEGDTVKQRRSKIL
jgi:hypothetical protein